MRHTKVETKQVRIATDIHRFLKILAAKEGRKMTQLINALLVMALKDEGFGK